MHAIKNILIFLLLLGSFPLQSKIIETYSIEEVIPYIQQDTWLLVDLDNAFFEARQALGHANWFYDQIEIRVQKGMSKEEAFADFYPEWAKIQKICPVKSVEKKTVSLLTDLQNKGITMMGFTHRQTTIADSTLHQVKSLDFDFSRTAPWKDDLSVPAQYPTLYTRGILFVNDFNSKGEVFQEFLKVIKKTPTKVVFIDDKRKNVEELEAVFQKLKIEYMGIHYRAIECAEPVYSKEIASFQYRHLDKILSNDATIVLIEEGIYD